MSLSQGGEMIALFLYLISVFEPVEWTCLDEIRTREIGRDNKESMFKMKAMEELFSWLLLRLCRVMPSFTMQFISCLFMLVFTTKHITIFYTIVYVYV